MTNVGQIYQELLQSLWSVATCSIDIWSTSSPLDVCLSQFCSDWTPPLTYPPEIGPYDQGFINHWFPFIRPALLKPCFWGGYAKEGRLTSHDFVWNPQLGTQPWDVYHSTPVNKRRLAKEHFLPTCWVCWWIRLEVHYSMHVTRHISFKCTFSLAPAWSRSNQYFGQKVSGRRPSFFRGLSW